MASSSAPDRRIALPAAIVVVALLALAPMVLGNYGLHLLIVSAIFTILASGFSLVVGYAGLLSLGHAAFFGLGAYTSALLYLDLGIPMWGGLLAAAAIGGASALLVGALVLKVRGNRFIITTVAFAEIMHLVAVNAVGLTRGQMGLPGIAAPKLVLPLLGTLDFADKRAFYGLAVAAAALCVGLVARIVRSPMGWALAALRENEALGESVGVSAYRTALLAFVIAGVLAGLAGSLYAHYMNFVSPDLFQFSYTTTMLVMVVIGGKTTISGPVLGAVLFTLLPEYLRVASDYRLIILGGILLIAVLTFPDGLIELLPWRTRPRSLSGAG